MVNKRIFLERGEFGGGEEKGILEEILKMSQIICEHLPRIIHESLCEETAGSA